MSKKMSITVIRIGLLIFSFLAGSLMTTTFGDKPTFVSTDEAAEQESLEVRYSRAHVRLAKMDLRRFLAVRARNPDALPREAGEDLQKHLAIDEEQLKQTLKGPDADLHQIYVRSAEIAVELAKRDLARNQEAYQQLPNRHQAFEVERAEAVLDVAKLHLEITKSKESSLSSMMYLQWQIDVLRNQVLELQQQVKAQATRN